MAQGEGKVAQAPFAPTSLYVGDLDFGVTEAQIYEIFNAVAPVISVRLCRDVVTRRSLGYAYVNFNHSEDATLAKESLKFPQVNGKPVRVMFSYRDPSIRKSGTGNVFVKNLDKRVDNQALHDLFSPFGSILSCKVATDPFNQSKEHGYVQFVMEEDAQHAIGKLNGSILHDRNLFVGPFVRKQERDSAVAKFSNVFVKNLAASTCDADLQEIFGAYGSISSAVVMRESDGRSKCFGFINFDNADDAARAVEELNGKKFQEKEIYVGRAQKKTEREAELKAKFEQDTKESEDKAQGTNLYLKNLDDDITDDKLRELFSGYGVITSCKVMKNPHGQSKGSGFVAFSSPDSAVRAVCEMNGKMLGSKPLYVAMAQKKEERKARLEAQFAMRAPSFMAPPAAPIAQQHFFYGQPHLGLIPRQGGGYGYQQPVMGPMRPAMVQMPNYYPNVFQRPHQQQQQQQPQQQQQQQPPRRPPPFNHQQQQRRSYNNLGGGGGGGGGGLSFGLELAAAPPEKQRIMLGEHLYPLVDALEHDHAGKITGMLLEMDQTEVLHLLEAQDALKSKVSEALEVLEIARNNNNNSNNKRVTFPTAELASLSLAS